MGEFEADFSKIYFFKAQNECILPNAVFKSPKWSIPELQSKKQELNKIKGRLGKYKLKVWSKHTANRDRAGFVIKKLAENIKPELLTQAWCKFYEILAHFPVVPLCAVSNKKIESLHLCEAPGAFVCALNHYLVLNYPGLEWSWNANTLNPNYEGNELREMIPDDRFIKYTLDNWIFGADFSGDITKAYNHEYLINLKQKSRISLVTADGSVDCMNDPGEQERHVEILHFCETLTALRILEEGGTFILKIFTIFEESTINLLFLLNCLFEKVAVFKPCTSKSGNSEVYIINTKFKGFSVLEGVWKQLWKAYEDINIFNSKSMFCLNELSDNFITDIHKCTEFFMKKQIETILNNIHHFENRSHDNIYMVKSFIAQNYLFKYNVTAIPEDSRILPNVCVAENWRIHSTKRCKNIYNVNVENILQNRKLSNIFHIVIGKKITVVHNSKFTYNDNLKKIQKVFVNNSTTSDFYKNILTILENQNIVINVKDFNISPFSELQKQLFYKIFSVISKGKNLILLNVPFVTHFLVGLLYILFYLFDKVYVGNGVVFLFRPKSCKLDSVLGILSSIKAKYKIIESGGQFDSDIVQIVSPDVFEYGSFSEIVWNYNNQLFFENKCFVRPFTYHL